jgi:hypothetical protein
MGSIWTAALDTEQDSPGFNKSYNRGVFMFGIVSSSETGCSEALTTTTKLSELFLAKANS